VNAAHADSNDDNPDGSSTWAFGSEEAQPPRRASQTRSG